MTVKKLKKILDTFDNDLIVVNGLNPNDESVNEIREESIVYWAENISGSVLMIR